MSLHSVTDFEYLEPPPGPEPAPWKSDLGRNDWPTPLTPLVGRQQELAAILASLNDDATRLLTLTGPGGVGKTRLALQVGAVFRDTVADGGVFVPLAAIADPALVSIAIAREFDVRESGDRPLADRLSQTLRSWRGLLILDNFEQVISAAPFVYALLESCSHLKVLVTSRTVLHLSGEREYVVPPLGLPAGPATIDEASTSDAISLFLQRTRAVRPTFALTSENVDAVVEICRGVDGLPLAIELAAARSKVLSPAALLARLGHSLQILTSGPTDQPSRLQTMRAAIAWSHDLLTPTEQVLLRRLAVFVGGFALEAAEAVCGTDALDERREATGARDRSPVASRVSPHPSVLDEISSLLDQSLLRRDEGPGEEPRFALLQTVREFGLELLDDVGETAALRDRHAAWCQELVDDAWQSWIHRNDVDRMILRLEREHDNLRAALVHLKQKGATGDLLRLAGGLFWFWYIRGNLREGYDYLLSGLEQGERTVTVRRARALVGAGTLAHYLGDQSRGESLLREGLADARALGDAWLTTFALLILGIAEEHQGHYEQAIPLFDEAVELTRASGDRIAFAQALSHRGLVGWASGEAVAGEALVLEALAVQRAAGDVWGVGDSLDLLGLIACERGDPTRAAAYVEESSTRRLAMGASKTVPWSLESAALLASATRRSVEAAHLFGAASALRGRIGSPGQEPEKSAYLRAIARTRVALGDSTFAAAWAAGQARSLDESLAQARAVRALSPSDAPASTPSAASTFGLTERETEVLALMVNGLSDREIGDALFISSRTAQKHAANIFTKLDVGTRTAAATAAIRFGIVSNEDMPPSPTIATR